MTRWDFRATATPRPCLRFRILAARSNLRELARAVLGGTFYGAYPTLDVNGPDDDGGKRGRWIPTTAIDQYGATLAAWYGLPANLLTTVFPNLSKFPTQNLGFLG